MKPLNHTFAALCLVVFGLVSCSDSTDEKSAEQGKDTFVLHDPEFEYAGALADSVVVQRADLDGDNIRDVVVRVLPADSAAVDTVSWFVYDASTQSFFRAQTVTPGAVVDVNCLSLDSASGAEIVIVCHDPWLDARELTIHSFAANTVVQFVDGNPLLDSIGNSPVIALHNTFWPFELSRAESVEYIDSIVVFNASNTYSSMLDMYLAKQQVRSDSLAIAELAAFETFSDRDFVAQFRLYESFARYYLYSKHVVGADSTAQLIASNTDLLSEYLPEEYIEALNGIVQQENLIQ